MNPCSSIHSLGLSRATRPAELQTDLGRGQCPCMSPRKRARSLYLARCSRLDSLTFRFTTTGSRGGQKSPIIIRATVTENIIGLFCPPRAAFATTFGRGKYVMNFPIVACGVNFPFQIIISSTLHIQVSIMAGKSLSLGSRIKVVLASPLNRLGNQSLMAPASLPMA